MDESALRTLLNNLDASRSSWHGLLHVFTFLVVVGLGFDLIVIIKEFWDDWKEFKYGQVHPYEIHLPKRPSVWLLVLGLFGTALIVVGVWGELYVDVRAGKIETQIREANDKLLGLIIQEAGDAKTSAEGAASAASRAEASAKVIGEQAAILEATVKRLTWQGPRDILLFNESGAFKKLKRFSGEKFRLSICRADFNIATMGFLGLTEVGRTAQALYELLTRVGWKVVGAAQGDPSLPMPYIEDNCSSNGVSANPSDSATSGTKEAAKALQSVLNSVLSQQAAPLPPPGH